MSERREGRAISTAIALIVCTSLLAVGFVGTVHAGGATGGSLAGEAATEDAPAGEADVTLATSASAGDTPRLLQQNGQFAVSEVTIESAEVQPGESVMVEGIVSNEGDEAASIDVSVEVDEDPVETRTAEGVQPDFPIVARFEISVDDPGTYTVSINGVEAERELTVTAPTEEGTDDQNEGTDESGAEDAGDESGTADGESDDGAINEEQFSVAGVTLERSEIQPGETVIVRADIANEGEEPADYEVTLEVDGEVVQGPEVVPEVYPETEVGAQHVFEYEPDGVGEYTISVNGVEANSTLEVSESDGGGDGPFGLFGMLPMWLVRPLVLFVALPLLVVYLALKALAIYLGY